MNKINSNFPKQMLLNHFNRINYALPTIENGLINSKMYGLP